MKGLEKYFELRNEVNEQVEKLTQLHGFHLNCKKGCDMCCYSFRVFPIEYYAIAQSTGLKGHPQTSDTIGETERCAFLKSGACTIYEHRPMICRTHGLPLLNMNEAGDDWELSFCELNFTDADDDEFYEGNVFVQDKFNSSLYQANAHFLQMNPHLALNNNDLVSLKSLLDA